MVIEIGNHRRWPVRNKIVKLNNFLGISYFSTTRPKRSDYSKVRVIKKNLVYIIGLAPKLAKDHVRFSPLNYLKLIFDRSSSNMSIVDNMGRSSR